MDSISQYSPLSFRHVLSSLLATVSIRRVTLCHAFKHPLFISGVTGLVSPTAVADGVAIFLAEKLTTFLVIVTTHPLPAFQLIVSPVPFVKFSRKNYFH